MVIRVRFLGLGEFLKTNGNVYDVTTGHGDVIKKCENCIESTTCDVESFGRKGQSV